MRARFMKARKGDLAKVMVDGEVSVGELATRLGVAKATASKVVNGHHVPRTLALATSTVLSTKLEALFVEAPLAKEAA